MRAPGRRSAGRATPPTRPRPSRITGPRCFMRVPAPAPGRSAAPNRVAVTESPLTRREPLADRWRVSVSEMALAQGMRETRVALERWRGDPRAILRGWVLGGFGFAAALLLAVL